MVLNQLKIYLKIDKLKCEDNNDCSYYKFKSNQTKLTCHDNIKVTMLVDKDQDNAKPDYMMDLYDKKNNKWRVFPTDPK